MYTEDEEFNYDDYLDENERISNKKPFIDIRFILRIILIILLIILVIFLVFKIRNNNIKKNNNKIVDNVEDVSLTFNNNMSMIVDVAHDYFFKDGNLPEKIGESKTITIKNLIDKKYINKVVDSKGYICGYNSSNATITKYKTYYKMEVRLVCTEKSDMVIYYYDLNGKCLNCNGETFNPEKETDIKEEPKKEEKQPVKEEPKQEEKQPVQEEPKQEEKQPVQEEPKQEEKQPVQEEEKLCREFSSWSNIYIPEDKYEVQTRTLVKGYKEETIYSDWSEPTQETITANDNLEVKVNSETKKVTVKTSWSKESTTKPKSKKGREISSRTVNKKYTTTSCTKDSTYTKILTKWDNSAYKCTTLGIGKVKCTYKVKGTCKNVTKTKKVVYYKYRDSVQKEITKTYYQSRTVDKNILYTDYILESDMPEGYTKLEGSELVQYRYREKCGK